MSLRLRYDSPSPEYGKVMDSEVKKVARAATAAVTEAAALIKAEGRSALAGFSSKFANAMSARVFPGKGDSLHPAAVVGLNIKYASVFEDGATIGGRPYLWLPIEKNLPVARGGKRWTPAAFMSAIGPLKSARHSGRPILLGQVRVGNSRKPLAVSKFQLTRRGLSGGRAQAWLPVFVGVSAVNDPKKYDVTSIIRQHADEIGELYARNWDELNRG